MNKNKVIIIGRTPTNSKHSSMEGSTPVDEYNGATHDQQMVHFCAEDSASDMHSYNNQQNDADINSEWPLVNPQVEQQLLINQLQQSQQMLIDQDDTLPNQVSNTNMNMNTNNGIDNLHSDRIYDQINRKMERRYSNKSKGIDQDGSNGSEYFQREKNSRKSVQNPTSMVCTYEPYIPPQPSIVSTISNMNSNNNNSIKEEQRNFKQLLQIQKDRKKFLMNQLYTYNHSNIDSNHKTDNINKLNQMDETPIKILNSSIHHSKPRPQLEPQPQPANLISSLIHRINTLSAQLQSFQNFKQINMSKYQALLGVKDLEISRLMEQVERRDKYIGELELCIQGRKGRSKITIEEYTKKDGKDGKEGKKQKDMNKLRPLQYYLQNIKTHQIQLPTPQPSHPHPHPHPHPNPHPQTLTIPSSQILTLHQTIQTQKSHIQQLKSHIEWLRQENNSLTQQLRESIGREKKLYRVMEREEARINRLGEWVVGVGVGVGVGGGSGSGGSGAQGNRNGRVAVREYHYQSGQEVRQDEGIHQGKKQNRMDMLLQKLSNLSKNF